MVLPLLDLLFPLFLSGFFETDIEVNPIVSLNKKMSKIII